MTYQVIARKYRPQKFCEVIGQEHVTQTLQNAVKSGRIHHAYLLTGSRGIGKTTIARLLAKALNCENGPIPEPCGECPRCREITDGNSMDVQEIDGASNTGVDDVREIREHLKYVPSSGRYKIYIIDEVHMLSNSAFNALLKSLEEPPPHVVFIFATTEAHKIPATILSRCQRFDLRRISTDLIVSALKRIAVDEKISADDDGLRFIAHEAMGTMRDAQSLLDQAVSFSSGVISIESVRNMLGAIEETLLFDVLNSISENNVSRTIDILEEIFKRGADLTRFALDLLAYVRNLLVIKECGASSVALDLTVDEKKGLEKIASKVDRERLQRIFSILHEGIEHLNRSPFPKMYLDVLLMRCASLEGMASLSEIISRLDELKDNGADAPVTKPTPKAVPALSSADWEGFMRHAASQRPQLASILTHGSVEGFNGMGVSLVFDNQLYADMLKEVDRKKQLDDLMDAHFGAPIKLDIKISLVNKKTTTQDIEREVTKQALSHDAVKKAADIFGATLHEVRNKREE